MAAINTLITELFTDIEVGNTKLGFKALASFSQEANAIISNSVTNELISLQMFILIEGLIMYLTQFTFDKSLIKKNLQFRDNCYTKLTFSGSYAQIYSSQIESTTLFFASVDGLISSKLLESLDISWNKKPWDISLSDKLESCSTTYANLLDHSNLLKDIPTDETGCLVPAYSADGGYILTKLDQYTEEFVKSAVRCNGKTLTIGSGYGLPERLSLLLGAQEVICNDICTEHLLTLKNLIAPSYHSKLKLIYSDFFANIGLTENSISLIGIFRVLHYFDPKRLIQAIQKIYSLLEPNGQLILSAETPYIANWKSFLPVYEKRVIEKSLWPGYITDSMYETGGYSKKFPREMHLLDSATLQRVLTENGFEIIECEYFSRAETFPLNCLSDGRESIGIIAIKR